MAQENQSLLGVTDLNSSEWQAYTEYVDRMILAGFCSAVRCSLQYLMDNTVAAQCTAPLFEVQLVLNGNKMTFDPSLDLSYSGNFYEIVDKMVANITNMASFIPRVATHKQQENYQVGCRLIIDLFALQRCTDLIQAHKYSICMWAYPCHMLGFSFL